MTKTYHKREWLNPENVFADSTITAYHGPHSFMDIKDEPVTCTETQLKIKDCHDSVRLHICNNDLPAFIDKIRLVEKVCKEFADFLESEVK